MSTFLLRESQNKLKKLQSDPDFLLDEIFGKDLDQNYDPNTPNDIYFLLKEKDIKIHNLNKTIENLKN